MKHGIIIYFSGIMILFLTACSPAVKIGKPVETAGLNDGTYFGAYKGGPNYAEVEVSIKNNQITDVKLIRHDAWKGHRADSIIPQRIIDHQSTDVDVVSGATNSSHIIMNATQKAIDKAYIIE